MIIFNERKRIENIINTRNKKAISNKYTLIKALIKYYYPQFKDKTWQEYHKFILSEMNLFDFDIAEYEEWEYSEFIKTTCKKALCNKFNIYLRELDYVEITEAELNKISSAENDQQKKVLFTLYVLAKLYPYQSGWVNYKDSEIFKLANVHLSIRERDLLFFRLQKQGLIQLNHIVGQSGVRVELIEDSPVALKIENERCFGNQYIAYVRGGKWMICEKCGRLIQRKNNRQRFCKQCYTKHHQEKSLEVYHESRK